MELYKNLFSTKNRLLYACKVDKITKRNLFSKLPVEWHFIAKRRLFFASIAHHVLQTTTTNFQFSMEKGGKGLKFMFLFILHILSIDRQINLNESFLNSM